MTSSEIYILVCRLHWRTDLEPTEIGYCLRQLGVNSDDYIHTNINHALVSYDNLNRVVESIIRCEEQSQIKAEKFKLNTKWKFKNLQEQDT